MCGYCGKKGHATRLFEREALLVDIFANTVANLTTLKQVIPNQNRRNNKWY